MAGLRTWGWVVVLLAMVCSGSVWAEDFAEGNANNWGTFASDGAARSVSNDTTRVKAGVYSVRFDTQSGFDTGVRYPKNGNAQWNLTDKNYLEFWEYAVNDTPYGFQDAQPIVVLRSPTGTYRYTPTSMLMYNKAWHRYRIPLAGDETWIRTTTGTPTMSRIDQLEIHHDTWDAGFTIYFDGVSFRWLDPNALPPPGPPPPPGVDPDAIKPRALLFVYNPVMENQGSRRMHEVFGWNDPVPLAFQVLADLEQSSHGKVQYQVIETQVVDEYPWHLDGFRYDDESYYADTVAHAWHESGFDYKRFLDDHGIPPRVMSGDIDEVLVYGGPGFGMWESTMAGDGGYWCNSGPVADVESTKTFVVMGWNFERGVAEALESYGHRTESIMLHSYPAWAPNRDNMWNAFTLLDKDAPGMGGVGNIHFPVNGMSDYDWANPRYVFSNADDWYNYPNLTWATEWFNYREWAPTDDDVARDYLNWWYDHLPHMSGRGNDFFLANWWRYIVDVDQFKGWDGNLYFTDGLPSVATTEPSNNQEVAGFVTVRAAASVDGALGRVDLYVDDVYHSSDTIAPYLFQWDARGLAGTHTLVTRAYELQNGTEGVAAPITVTIRPVPREISPPGAAALVIFTSPTDLTWEAAFGTGADSFNLYRGEVSGLASGDYGACLAPDLGTNAASDLEIPGPGIAWHYLVTGRNPTGEGPLGNRSTGEPRTNPTPCP